ncbi:hypothetical protein VTL71DRAFT_5229 [Oculimacula yallundae]|uniref:WSC domain-containing protein n=1 Tax=Oculimacula yallundae TaxID=86028 RepID=A0ABR4C248_9HELO
MRSTVFTVFSTLCLTISVANASPLQVLDSRAEAVIPGYKSEGCYTEATNKRALSSTAYFDDFMTLDKCAAACSSFNWFGVEYGRECYCGDSPNPGSVPAPATECSFKCPGNGEQTCGAGNRLSMYSKTSIPLPTVPSTIYSSEGCYTEATTGRALADKRYDDDTMTIEKCATTCTGFEFFGLEYYQECYCGNSLSAGSVPAPSTECRFSCLGDPSQTCGGNSRLNVYKFGPATTATPAPSLTSTTPVPVPTGPTYVSDGCYTEATTGRALSLSNYYDDKLTVQKCAAVCSGYTLFGVEYGRECYCGNKLNAGSISAPASECSIACKGDATQTCGGSKRLNLYHHAAAVSSTTSVSSTQTSSSSSLAVPSSSSSSVVVPTTTSSASPSSS